MYGHDYPEPVEVDPRAVDVDGAELLERIEEFLGRFVAYPGEAERVAHTLWIAHAWFMGEWDSTPRLAFLSPEPGSGKSRALEVTEPLVPNPVHAVNATPAYLFRKVSDPDGLPTILYDEIDTVFGPRAKDNEDIRGMINAGHRKGATAGRAVIRGKQVFTEELPAYCAVALAGLDDLPDTIMTRSVVVRMRRRSPSERVEPWRRRLCEPQAVPLRADLRTWSAVAVSAIRWPQMPDGVEDRDADVWEALLAVADLAGGSWPERAREAALILVGKSKDRSGSLGVVLLRDLRAVFSGRDRLPTEDVIEALVNLVESPWAELRGKTLDARGLSRRLAKYGVKPKLIRDGERVFRGYEASDLADPWERYLPAAGPDESALAVTPATGDAPAEHGRNAVTDVTDTSGDVGADVAPRTEASWESPIERTGTEENGTRPSPRASVTSVTPATAEVDERPICTTCSRQLGVADRDHGTCLPCRRIATAEARAGVTS